MIRKFTWKEFDECVHKVSVRYKNITLSGIYGIPRGGLCIAVALSHKLNLVMHTSPQKGSLIVDDIYDSGLTLNNLKGIEGAQYCVFFSKAKPTWWKTIHLADKKDWIVFPWEDYSNVYNDQNDYNLKRN